MRIGNGFSGSKHIYQRYFVAYIWYYYTKLLLSLSFLISPFTTGNASIVFTIYFVVESNFVGKIRNRSLSMSMTMSMSPQSNQGVPDQGHFLTAKKNPGYDRVCKLAIQDVNIACLCCKNIQ